MGAERSAGAARLHPEALARPEPQHAHQHSRQPVGFGGFQCRAAVDGCDARRVRAQHRPAKHDLLVGLDLARGGGRLRVGPARREQRAQRRHHLAGQPVGQQRSRRGAQVGSRFAARLRAQLGHYAGHFLVGFLRSQGRLGIRADPPTRLAAEQRHQQPRQPVGQRRCGWRDGLGEETPGGSRPERRRASDDLSPGQFQSTGGRRLRALPARRSGAERTDQQRRFAVGQLGFERGD